MLHVGGSLIAVDGYLDSKTAALSKPYSDEPSNSGKLLLHSQIIGSFDRTSISNGFSASIQAMGDKAIEITLDAIEQTAKANVEQPVRFRIEQAAVLNPAINRAPENPKNSGFCSTQSDRHRIFRLVCHRASWH